MSLDIALGVARSGLAAVQRSLAQTAQNIANADTPGYTRKTVPQQALVVGDLPAGLRAYEQTISRYVELSRAAAVKTMRSVIPASRTAVRLVPWATATLVKLPASIQKLAWSQNGLGKALAALQLPDYEELANNR